MGNIPFTGVVVSFNSARYLRQCLQRLLFCHEIVLVDLGSRDSSLEIAKTMGARIVSHPWVDIVEKVRRFAADQAQTDWVVFMDPDLMFPAPALPTITRIINEDPMVGFVSIRYQNYFQGKALHYGRWGGKNSAYPAVLHRDRVMFGDAVHRGIHLKAGFRARVASDADDHLIVHHWADSYSELADKSKRYLAEEGRSRYSKGERTSWIRVSLAPVHMLFLALVVQRGFLDGTVGVGLSYFAAWYDWRSELSLLTYQSMLGSTKE